MFTQSFVLVTNIVTKQQQNIHLLQVIDAMSDMDNVAPDQHAQTRAWHVTNVACGSEWVSNKIRTGS